MAKKAQQTKKRPAAKATAKKTVKKPIKKPVKVASKAAPKRKPARPAVKAAPAPRGFALVNLSAGVTANDAEASIKWYCDVLGFAVKERWEHEGQFLGAQLESGAVTINVGQDNWKLGRDRVKGQGMRLYIMTGPDIDQFAAGIKARGGSLDQEPADGWGMRAFSISDPDGFKLTFMTML